MWRGFHALFYATTTGYIKLIVTPNRMRWQDFDEGSCRVDVGVCMPVALARYHDAAGAIDLHNRVQKDLLDLEKIVDTHRWEMRLGCTVLEIILMDSRYIHKFGCSGRRTLLPYILFAKLRSELVKNQFDSVGIDRTFADHFNEETQEVTEEEIRRELTDLITSKINGKSPRLMQRR